MARLGEIGWENIGGEGWQEKVHNGEERKKLLRTTRILRIRARANGMNKTDLYT